MFKTTRVVARLRVAVAIPVGMLCGFQALAQEQCLPWKATMNNNSGFVLGTGSGSTPLDAATAAVLYFNEHRGMLTDGVCAGQVKGWADPPFLTDIQPGHALGWTQSWDNPSFAPVCQPNKGPVYGIEINAVTCPAQISLIGGSSTKALPAGPALPQTARVTQYGAPVPGRSVTVSIGGAGTVGGVTNAAGEFNFTYVPPHIRATDRLSATCDTCSNTAQKLITVDACDVCQGKGR